MHARVVRDTVGNMPPRRPCNHFVSGRIAAASCAAIFLLLLGYQARQALDYYGTKSISPYHQSDLAVVDAMRTVHEYRVLLAAAHARLADLGETALPDGRRGSFFAPPLGLRLEPIQSTPPLQSPCPAHPHSATAPVDIDFNASVLYSDEAHDHLAAEKLGLPDSGLAPFTKAAQRLIYEHQHPPDGCAGQTFLQSFYSSGMGSIVHVATYHLALALETGRIFVWGKTTGGLYTDPTTCARGGDHTVNNFECWFRAPSSCTFADSIVPGADTLVANKSMFYNWRGFYFDFVPSKLRALLDRSPHVIGPMAPGQVKFWYRTQAAAYLMRFNGPALRSLRDLRLAGALNVAGPSTGDGKVWASSLSHSFPLPRGTVSLHVRHGDKGSEMALVDSLRYFEAAERAVVALGPHGYARGGFVSTEDPDVIELARALPNRTGDAGQLNGWAWAWYEVPRVNSNGGDQLAKLGWPRGKLTDVWWLQMFLALEADAWVGTRGSNWNRMIDELRCVWLPKCKHAYVEVGDHASWHKYGW